MEIKETERTDREKRIVIARPVSPLPRLSFHLHPPTTAILYLPLPPPHWQYAQHWQRWWWWRWRWRWRRRRRWRRWWRRRWHHRQHYDRPACFRSQRRRCCTGAQSVVAVGVRWLKGNRFESGATLVKDKHVAGWSTCSGLAAGSRFSRFRFDASRPKAVKWCDVKRGETRKPRKSNRIGDKFVLYNSFLHACEYHRRV